MDVSELEVHVVPTWNGKWAVLSKPEQVRRWERLWRWYWPLIGRFLNAFPGMWRHH